MRASNLDAFLHYFIITLGAGEKKLNLSSSRVRICNLRDCSRFVCSKEARLKLYMQIRSEITVVTDELQKNELINIARAASILIKLSSNSIFLNTFVSSTVASQDFASLSTIKNLE